MSSKPAFLASRFFAASRTAAAETAVQSGAAHRVRSGGNDAKPSGPCTAAKRTPLALRLPLGLLGFIGLGTAQAQHVVQALPSLRFDLPELVIEEGETVRFENAGGFHNVREVDSAEGVTLVPNGFCAPAPGCLASAAAWSTVIAFPQAGTYHYLCEVHGTAMRGQVTVLAGLPVEPQLFASGFEGS